MITELEMKQKLDGWFYTYVSESQMVKARKVPVDFIPSHKPKMLEEYEKPKTAYQWSQREDDLLIEVRHKNKSWREVANCLRMSPSAVRNRYLELCRQRNMPEYKIVVRPPEVLAIESRILSLRDDDKSFSEIAAILSITRNQVAGIVQRIRRRRELEDVAA